MADKFFSLPFPVRIANDSVTDQRYVVADDTVRDKIITDSRAYLGMQIYHTTDAKIYYLKTYPTPGNIIGAVWEVFNVGTIAGVTTFPQSILAAYTDLAAAKTDQATQVLQGLYRIGTDVFELFAKTNADTDYHALLTIPTVTTYPQSVLKEYLDLNDPDPLLGLIADQANQIKGGLYYVDDATADPDINLGFAVYQYRGTTHPGTPLIDYIRISKEHDNDTIPYTGIATAAIILAKPVVLGEVWWASDTFTEYRGIAIAGSNIWQITHPLKLDAARQVWGTPDLPDGYALDIGEDVFFSGQNLSGAAITKLDPKVVVVAGIDATNPKVKEFILPVASDIAAGVQYGLTATAFVIGGIGKVAVFGLVQEINTSAWATNDILFIDPTTAGALTNVPPIIDGWIVGRVMKSDATTGIIDIFPEGIHSITTPAKGGATTVEFFTADLTTVAVADDFYEAVENSRGIVASASQIIALPNAAGSIVAIGKDFITNIFASSITLPPAINTAQLEWEINTAAEVKLHLEVYQANAATGVPEDSGIVAVPITDFPGVHPIVVLDSALVDAASATREVTQLIGYQATLFNLPTNKRLRYHIRVERVTSGGGTKNVTIFSGSDHTSYTSRAGALELNDLKDVTITTPVAAQVLTYEAGVWINKTSVTTSAIAGEYTSIAAMIAAPAQALQLTGAIYRVVDASADTLVTSGYAYYEKLATSTTNITDYVRVSTERVQPAGTTTKIQLNIDGELDTNDKLSFVGGAALEVGDDAGGKAVLVAIPNAPSLRITRGAITRVNIDGGSTGGKIQLNDAAGVTKLQFSSVVGEDSFMFNPVVIGGSTKVAGVTLTIQATDAIALPSGTTAQRPTAVVGGLFRFNSDTNKFEGNNGTAWGNLGASPAGLTTQIQYNDSGAFGADDKFVWNKTTELLTLGDDTAKSVIGRTGFSFTTNAHKDINIDTFGINIYQVGVAVAKISIGIINPNYAIDASGMTSSIKVPVGTTAQRPGVVAGTTATKGMFRFNDTTKKFEGYDDTDWKTFGLTVAGATTQVQYNDNGVLGADAQFIFNKTANSLAVGTVAGLSAMTPVGVSAQLAGIAKAIIKQVAGNGSLEIKTAAQNGAAEPEIKLAADSTVASYIGGTAVFGFGTKTPDVKLAVDIISTKGIRIPVGTTTQRPTLVQADRGVIRFNATTNRFEGYNGSVDGAAGWENLGAGVATIPAGADNQIQFRTGGATPVFGASTFLNWDANQLKVGAIAAAHIAIAAAGITMRVGVTLPTTTLTAGKLVLANVTQANTINLDAASAKYPIEIVSTKSIKLPVGTAVQRPALVATDAGAMRFNSDTSAFEGWDGTKWGALGGTVTLESIIMFDSNLDTERVLMQKGPITIASIENHPAIITSIAYATSTDGLTWTTQANLTALTAYTEAQPASGFYYIRFTASYVTGKTMSSGAVMKYTR